MADSKKIREWASAQTPPLAKPPGSRGRLSWACVDAWNAANPDDVYVETGKYVALNPQGPRKPKGEKAAAPEGSRSIVTGPMTQSVATHTGTELQPSAQAVEPAHEEPAEPVADVHPAEVVDEFTESLDEYENIQREPFEESA